MKQKKEDILFFFFFFFEKIQLSISCEWSAKPYFLCPHPTHKKTINIKMLFAAAVSSTLRINFAGTLDIPYLTYLLYLLFWEQLVPIGGEDVSSKAMGYLLCVGVLQPIQHC